MASRATNGDEWADLFLSAALDPENWDRAIKAMAAVTETGGTYLRVSDEEILAAIPTLARGSGVFAEPAGATPYAGLVTAVEKGLVGSDDTVVLLATGSGLKDVASALKAVAAVGTTPMRIDPNLESLRAALNN